MDAEKIFEVWWAKNIPAPTRAKDILYPGVKETARYIATTFLAIGRREGLEEAAAIADKLVHVDCADQWSMTRTGAFKSFSDAIRQRIEGEK